MEIENLFIESLEKVGKLFSQGVVNNIENHPEMTKWLLDPLQEWTQKAYGPDAFDAATKGYITYCMNVAKCQKVYEVSGDFCQAGSLPEVKDKVYESEEYMVPYMWAAVLIYAFWPSMVNHLYLFRKFTHQIPSKARVLEMACGHGVLGLLTAKERPDVRVDGFDLSVSAISIAKKLQVAADLGQRVNFEAKDILEFPPERGQFDAIVAAMLAEHLEDPRKLLQSIAYHLADDGIVYFSTALESAQPDHIFEFHRESEPILIAEEAGLRVVELVCDAAKPGKNFTPRALAMILRRNNQ